MSPPQSAYFTFIQTNSQAERPSLVGTHSCHKWSYKLVGVVRLNLPTINIKQCKEAEQEFEYKSCNRNEKLC